jgi:hypothetical protein
MGPAVLPHLSPSSTNLYHYWSEQPLFSVLKLQLLPVTARVVGLGEAGTHY